jgi:hypothetical protein
VFFHRKCVFLHIKWVFLKYKMGVLGYKCVNRVFFSYEMGGFEGEIGVLRCFCI